MKTDRSKKEKWGGCYGGEEGMGEETIGLGGLPQYGLVQLHSGEREDGVRRKRREEKDESWGGRGG